MPCCSDLTKCESPYEFTVESNKYEGIQPRGIHHLSVLKTCPVEMELTESNEEGSSVGFIFVDGYGWQYFRKKMIGGLMSMLTSLWLPVLPVTVSTQVTSASIEAILVTCNAVLTSHEFPTRYRFCLQDLAVPSTISSGDPGHFDPFALFHFKVQSAQD